MYDENSQYGKAYLCMVNYVMLVLYPKMVMFYQCCKAYYCGIVHSYRCLVNLLHFMCYI